VVAARGIKVVSDLLPDPKFFNSLIEEFTEPIYLRRPDAVATADRK
jgi:hypothetical protein